MKLGNPRGAKIRLAFEIVKIYHGEKSAKEAEEEFNKVFRKHELPGKIPVAILKRGSCGIINLLLKLNLVKSKSEARRLVNENAVKINGEKVKDPKIKINVASGLVVQIGKKRFVKIGIK
jgi:tyrosyl-tRNA synthetase